jgi:hypothetical protein
MARTPTLPPDHSGMWRRLISRAHPDAGGDHELFIWTGAVRDVVCGQVESSFRNEKSDRSDNSPGDATDEPTRVPYPGSLGANFAALTGRALEYGGEFAPVLNLLRDCWPVEGLAHEQGRGATYKKLAAIGHAWGMTKAERVRWYRVAESIPLSDRHAGHILAWSKRSAA